MLLVALVAPRAEAEPLVSIPPDEIAGLVPDPADVAILHPARGLVAFARPGEPLFAYFELRTALTPPPGIQQDRALFGWEAALSTSSHVAVPDAPPHRYPVRVSQIRPAGPTLLYRFRFEIPAWVPPDTYDLEVAGPGFRATRGAGVRVVDPDRSLPVAYHACAPGEGVPQSAWDALDVEAVVLSLESCPEVAIDPVGLPHAALVVASPRALAADIFRKLIGPTRFAVDAGGHRLLFAGDDRAFADAEHARAKREGRAVTSIPLAGTPDGRTVRLSPGGAPQGPRWNPREVSLEASALEIRAHAPRGVSLRFAVVTDGAAWRVVGPDGVLDPVRVATAGPPAIPGVPEAAILYFVVEGTGSTERYRAQQHDVRPPVASLWIDGERAGAAPHPARVGQRVSLEVRSDEAAAIVWDLGEETGESARGARASLTYKQIGRHSITAVVLGPRGNRRTLSADLDVAVGGGGGCAVVPAPYWTGAGGSGIILFALGGLGNSERRAERSRRRT
jgi:hypothetical protein